jgi:SAM-dependent methyltransferase
MSGARRCQIYERIAASGIADGCVRPGGLKLTERALSICAFSPGSRLLDVGCGTGATVQCLIERHGFFAAGVDASLRMLDPGRAGSCFSWLIRASAESLPFRDAEWDGILAECSLSLIGDPDAALRECLRVLRPGGKLILSDVYLKDSEAVHDFGALDQDRGLPGAPSKDELVGKLRKAGFTVFAWEDHSTALKHFAAQLILSGTAELPFRGSLMNAGPFDGLGAAQKVSSARYGYFLAVAVKSPGDGWNGLREEERLCS